MTREEAIHRLAFMQQYYTWRDGEVEAFEMAIEALQTDIVLCGECKHMMPDGRCEEFADDAIRPSVSDFCSYGERREE